MRARRRVLVAVAALFALLCLPGYMWQQSLVPDTYSVMDMGYADFGGGPGAPAHASHGLAANGLAGSSGPATVSPELSVASLTGPVVRPADVAVTLVARKESFRLASGEQIKGYTLNGTSPGPDIRAVQGQLIEVRLVNESVSDGATLHWHGVDVPNAEDGVAGVTQDAVELGAEHVYRFVAEQAGTYWYHSHQVSHEQVRAGLFGALVVTPEDPGPPAAMDVLAPVHTYEGKRTIAGRVGQSPVDVAPGSLVRVRVINTDGGPMRAWVSGAAYRVLAVDGVDLRKPTPVDNTAVVVTAGGRVDLELSTPVGGSAVRIAVGGTTAVVLGPPGVQAPNGTEPKADLDLLGYGSPAPLSFDPELADRRFAFRIGRRIGFLDGRPGFWWTVNGHRFPDVPMFVVSEGDVVRMLVANESGQVHPMHLHGHHAVVLSRDGKPATGSPWWVDSLNVADGETYEIAFVADNPGIWMDHCHNLPHAAQGLVAHLAYAGVTEPFLVGGQGANRPE